MQVEGAKEDDACPADSSQSAVDSNPISAPNHVKEDAEGATDDLADATQAVESTDGAVRPLVEGLGASMTAKKSVAAAAAFVTAMIGPAVWLTENAIIITDISTLESRFELGCK